MLGRDSVLALALQRLGPAAAASDLTLVPPLTLSGPEAPGTAAAPDLSPDVPEAARGSGRAGWYALSSGGILLGDVIAGGLIAVAVASAMDDLFTGGGHGADGLVVAGLATWLFLPRSWGSRALARRAPRAGGGPGPAGPRS